MQCMVLGSGLGYISSMWNTPTAHTSNGQWKKCQWLGTWRARYSTPRICCNLCQKADPPYKPNQIKWYTPTKKYPGSRDFLRQISTVFGNFLKKYLRYREVIYLIGKPSFSAFRRSKDIRCGYPHKIATPLWMKVELFSLKRAWRISRSGHALCL